MIFKRLQNILSWIGIYLKIKLMSCALCTMEIMNIVFYITARAVIGFAIVGIVTAFLLIHL
jgi:hypothetical protein